MDTEEWSHCECHTRGLLERICIVYIIILRYTAATQAYYRALITYCLSRYVTCCSKEKAAICHA